MNLQEILDAESAELPPGTLEIRWDGDQIEQISVRPGWQKRAALNQILIAIVDEVAARHPAPPQEFVDFHADDRPLSWDELMDLQHRLHRYNQARAKLETVVEQPEHTTTQVRNARAYWLGEQLLGLDVDDQWATETTAQALSDTLTQVVASGPSRRPPTQSKELDSAAARLAEFWS